MTFTVESTASGKQKSYRGAAGGEAREELRAHVKVVDCRY